MPAVDLAVAYGAARRARRASSRSPRSRCAPGRELDARELTAALRALPGRERPAIVQVVDEIPVTTWYRPLTGPLREAGIPPAGERASGTWTPAASATGR